jgi:hypothetical protein
MIINRNDIHYKKRGSIIHISKDEPFVFKVCFRIDDYDNVVSGIYCRTELIKINPPCKT